MGEHDDVFIFGVLWMSLFLGESVELCLVKRRNALTEFSQHYWPTKGEVCRGFAKFHNILQPFCNHFAAPEKSFLFFFPFSFPSYAEKFLPS